MGLWNSPHPAPPPPSPPPGFFHPINIRDRAGLILGVKKLKNDAHLMSFLVSALLQHMDNHLFCLKYSMLFDLRYILTHLNISKKVVRTISSYFILFALVFFPFEMTIVYMLS